MLARSLTTIALLTTLCCAPLSAQQAEWELPPEPGVAERGVSGNPLIKNCQVNIVDSVELPATEAGVLIFQGMKEGAAVKAEDVIARIDSQMQEMEKRIAIYEYNAAVKRANDNIEIKYSKKAAEVARAAYDELVEVRNKMPKAISDPEFRKTKLDWERSILAIEKAVSDQALSLLDAHAARGKVDASAVGIDRRTILAPFDGEVTKVYRHQQEWVNPGDPILQLVRLDTLKVEGWVYLADYSREEIEGCEVTIEVPGYKGREEKANGRITWINPILTRGDRSQKMLVRAEITNRSKNGQWIILPNMRGEMTIHLGTGGVSVGARETRP